MVSKLRLSECFFFLSLIMGGLFGPGGGGKFSSEFCRGHL